MSEKITKPPRTDNPDDLQDFYEQIERHLTLVGTVTVDVANITAGTVATFTIPVAGCRVNKQQSVILAPPSAIDASLLWCGVVSADNTVTVRLYNPTAGGINPNSGVWGARVML